MFQVQAELTSVEMVSMSMSYKYQLRSVIGEPTLLHRLELLSGRRDVLAVRSMKSVNEDALFTSRDHHTFVSQIGDLTPGTSGHAARIRLGKTQMRTGKYHE